MTDIVTDYTITHNPTQSLPWAVMDGDLCFDLFKTKEEAEATINELDVTGLFRDRIQMLIEEFSDELDISPIDFIQLVEYHQCGSIRGLWD